MTAASPFSNRARTRGVAERFPVDASILPEMDLGEVVELGAGERGEQRMVEGDLAQHHVVAPTAASSMFQGGTPASAASVSARPGAVTT